MKIYACSSNSGKLREFALASHAPGLPAVEVEALPGLNEIAPPHESGATFEENALIKALYYSEFSPEIVLAEDSGLEARALDGAPGVFSARFAGENATATQNNDYLLQRLRGVLDRSARFVTVSVFAQKGKVLAQGFGTVEGRILESPRGTGGFGYDPLFYYPPYQRSFAELSDSEKFAVSARGKSLRTALQLLAQSTEVR